MKRKKDFNIEPRRHVAAMARDQFSQSHPDVFIASTLGKNNPDYYLRNRIESAFLQGWNAAERHYGHIIERISAGRKQP